MPWWWLRLQVEAFQIQRVGVPKRVHERFLARLGRPRHPSKLSIADEVHRARKPLTHLRQGQFVGDARPCQMT